MKVCILSNDDPAAFQSSINALPDRASVSGSERCYQGGLSMDIPGIRCLTCIHIKVCSLKPTLLMYEMMAKEMGISLHCPNYIDISRLRPEKGQKDDAS